MNKVPPILKKILKVIFWMVAIFMLIFILIACLIQIPAIQNKIVNYATTYISNKTHTKVEIKNVSISFPKSVVIKGLYLEDLHKDTLIYAGEANINIALTSLYFNEVAVNSVAFENLNVNLYNTERDSLFNYNFLLTAFNDTTKKATPKTPSKWTFSIDNVSLKNIRLRYDDEFGGTNISGSLAKLELQIDKIDFAKSIYSMDKLLIEKLRANVLLKKSSKSSNKKSKSVLPIISAKNIQINNSSLNYGDYISKLSIVAAINKFKLEDGAVNLQKQLVILDKIYLSKSNIQYITSDTTTTSDSKKTAPADATENDWKVSVKNIDLEDNSLRYKVGNKAEIKNAFDADNLQYHHVNLVASYLYYSPDKTAVLVTKFSAIDHNNFAITKFETNFDMDAHSITAKKLKAKTTNSSIDGDLKLQFTSLKTLKDSFPFLVLNLNLKNSSIQNSDILYFSQQLNEQAFFKNKANITTVSGRINGRVNNLNGKKLQIKTGINTILETDFNIIGLPNVQTAYYDLPNLKIISGKQDIKMMTGSAISDSINLPKSISMDVVFKGKIKSFTSAMKMNSSYGDANLVATIDPNENFNGNLNILNFDLGSLLKNKKMYGPVTLAAKVNGHGLDKKTMTANIKAEASQIYLNKYTYHNLKMDGSIADQQFKGKINLNDENAVFDFDGLVNTIPNHEQFKFHLNVQGADLQKLNLSKDNNRISFKATADLKGGKVADLNGNAGITNMIIVHQGKKYVLDSVLIASINQPNKSEMNLSSALVGIKYSGTLSPTALPEILTQFINNYFPITDTKLVQKKSEPATFNFEISLHNHPILTEVLFPELKEFEPGIIQGSFDSQKNELKLTGNMKRIVYGTTEINNLAVDVNSDSKALNYAISSSDITNSQIKLDHILIDGKLADNKITTSISSIDSIQNKKLLVQSEITKVQNDYQLVFDPKYLYLMNNRWNIADDNYIKFGKQGFLIHHLFINNTASEINIASVHNQFNDDLNIAFKNFKLEDISHIVEKDSSIVKGNVDGNVLLKRVNNSYGIIADAKIAGLFVRNASIGDLALKAENPTTQRFDIEAKLSGAENNLTASGYFSPNGGNNSLNIKADIQSLSMKTVEAFSMGQITAASGSVNGNFQLTGKTDAPEITGVLTFNDAFLKPSYLNNRIELKHETILLKPDGIYFNSFTMLDPNNHTAIINGVVNMKQFSDFLFALQVNTKDFLLFNTTVKDNEEFYGKMIIDSKINIKGPMSLPVINGKLKLKKGSNFTFAVPEDKLSTNKGEEVVEFGDSLKLNPILNRNEKKEIAKPFFKGFDISSIVEVDKDATLKLLLDPTSTDSLVVKGEAALSFIMDRSGKMSLTGAYNLNEGSYLLSLEDLIKRKFNIIPGSTITWNGDPLDANISINATYSVRAAPYDLLANQLGGLSAADQNGYKQTFPFLVLLKLRGAILQPEISFEIQLAPEDKGILGGAVNQKLTMLNEDPSALNKQVFALLILGRFIQENPLQTESSPTSTLIRSTVGTYLSTQLNQLSSKVAPGVGLNFNIQSYNDYQTGQAQGRTQVEIGLKKQLFNERLSVELGGSVDVEGKAASQNSASDITGDVTLEYKLTEDGRYRLRGFRHNQYEGAIEGQIIETGAGVVYVRDFNKWKDLFKSQKKE